MRKLFFQTSSIRQQEFTISTHFPMRMIWNPSQKRKKQSIMATGLGHVADRLLPKIRELTDEGKHFVITSQCLYGRVDLEVYASGRKLLAAGAVPLENMLPETALAKSMYVLAHHPDEFEKWMTKNLRGEISERSLLGGEL